MFRLVAVAAIAAVVFFILGVCLGAWRHKEPGKKENPLRIKSK